jgi:exodeoxyribonuclease V beta subunit
MCGAPTPTVDGHVAGVFDWAPPTGLIVSFSDLIEGVR